MQKKIIIIGAIFISLAITLAGCEEQSTKIENKHKDIFFESDVLAIIDSSVETFKDNGLIRNVEVTIRFQNLLNERITINYALDFCDKENNTLYHKTYTIGNFPPNYIEQSNNIFSYSGEDAYKYDHVNIYIEDYEIIA